MDELTSLGLILLLALLAGHLVKVVKVPEVTGYILAGIALGPSVLGWVSAENLAALEVLSEVALGLILFSIGSVFEFSRFRRRGSASAVPDTQRVHPGIGASDGRNPHTRTALAGRPAARSGRDRHCTSLDPDGDSGVR